MKFYGARDITILSEDMQASKRDRMLISHL